MIWFAFAFQGVEHPLLQMHLLCLSTLTMVIWDCLTPHLYFPKVNKKEEDSGIELNKENNR